MLCTVDVVLYDYRSVISSSSVFSPFLHCYFALWPLIHVLNCLSCWGTTLTQETFLKCKRGNGLPDAFVYLSSGRKGFIVSSTCTQCETSDKKWLVLSLIIIFCFVIYFCLTYHSSLLCTKHWKYFWWWLFWQVMIRKYNILWSQITIILVLLYFCFLSSFYLSFRVVYFCFSCFSEQQGTCYRYFEWWEFSCLKEDCYLQTIRLKRKGTFTGRC